MSTSKLSWKPDEMLGGYLRWTSIPSRRHTCSNTPLELLHATETGISKTLFGHQSLEHEKVILGPLWTSKKHFFALNCCLDWKTMNQRIIGYIFQE